MPNLTIVNLDYHKYLMKAISKIYSDILTYKTRTKKKVIKMNNILRKGIKTTPTLSTNLKKSNS